MKSLPASEAEAHFGEHQADLYLAQIEQRILSLMETPYVGTARLDFRGLLSMFISTALMAILYILLGYRMSTRIWTGIGVQIILLSKL